MLLCLLNACAACGVGVVWRKDIMVGHCTALPCSSDTLIVAHRSKTAELQISKEMDGKDSLSCVTLLTLC